MLVKEQKKVESMKRKYRMCVRCVMDTTDPEIEFDKNGRCNHCRRYFAEVNENVFHGSEGRAKLEALLSEIKQAGRGKEYDCLIGISGGVDSTYLALMAKKEWGLRPLAVHFDNGWNSELAVMNISNVLKRLNIDLYTYVVNWEEFKDLQLSYIKASVVDIEVPTDHGITATTYKAAKEYNIKYVLSGNNFVTESILPKSWRFDKNDHINLLDIHRKYGKIKLKTYPIYDTYLKIYSKYIKQIKIVRPLNYINYNCEETKNEIINELGWRDYGGKHCESIFTKFYQRYILPEKFNIDKRRAHLSTLICSNQISRENALNEISFPPYKEENLFEADYDYVLKKFGFTETEFQLIMNSPIRSHYGFRVKKSIVEKYPLIKLFRPVYRRLKK
ncbi:MAG: N-acetyl sugar amidotransferase [Candidatus Scalindua sp.]